jgi:hypothetical protein
MTNEHAATHNTQTFREHMHKEVTIKEDGRRLIFYTFTNTETDTLEEDKA